MEPFSTLTVPEDLYTAFRNIRQADLIEISASHVNPLGSLISSHKHSVNCISLWTPEKNLMGVLGIVKCKLTGTEGYVGNPWFVSTPYVEEYPLWFVRKTKYLADYWLEYHFNYLVNWVDAEYVQAHKWLRMLGFTVEPCDPPLYWGGREFYKALKTKK